MFRILATTAALALLTACGDGQPFDFGVVEPVDPPLTEEEIKEQAAISESIAGGLIGGTYSTASGTLTVRIPFDAGDINTEYARNTSLDVPGYLAFSSQDDPLDRIYIGMAARSADNSVEGVLAMDGGQFLRFFGGTTFRQIGTYSEPPVGPTTGLVSYAGSYIGLSNLNANTATAGLPIPPGTNPALIPDQAGRVTGDVFINADFAENEVNGAIVNRDSIDNGFVMSDVFLIATDIDANGRFLGSVENAAQDDIGDYGGTFGGLNASGVAGGVHLTDFLDNVDGEEEFGIFVLTQCGLTGDAAICDDVQPDF
jgi:hypothetical protein